MNTRLLISCIAENTIKYHFMTMTLCKTLRQFGGPAGEAKVVVHFVDSVDEHVRRRLEELGAKIKIVSRFDPRSPHCNKIRMLEIEDDYDVLITLDCDMAVVRDFSHLVSPDTIKYTYSPLVLDADRWDYLYRSNGLKIPEDQTKVHFGCSALFIPKKFVSTLWEAWSNYANWFMDFTEANRDPGWHSYYTDQISLSLALVSQKFPVELLPGGLGFHTNFYGDPSINDQLYPYILHYHGVGLDENWLLKKQGHPKPDSCIRKVNELILSDDFLLSIRKSND